MIPRFIIVCPEKGVYLGAALGLAFWSKLEPLGLGVAVTFDTCEDAADFRLNVLHEEHAHVLRVDCLTTLGATMTECVAAGAPGWQP